MYKVAYPKDELEVDKLARLSPFTRDFANPPMSLKTMRAEAFTQRQVILAKSAGKLVGFVWCRPMKPKHMPFSTIYYMGVHPDYHRSGVATGLLREALSRCPFGRVELVCEDGNEAAAAFYARQGGAVVSKGTVGKDERPYTRWAFTRGQS